MDLFVIDSLVGVRMFGLGSLIFRSFGAGFVALTAFVLEPDFYARLECFLGRST